MARPKKVPTIQQTLEQYHRTVQMLTEIAHRDVLILRETELIPAEELERRINAMKKLEPLVQRLPAPAHPATTEEKTLSFEDVIAFTKKVS